MPRTRAAHRASRAPRSARANIIVSASATGALGHLPRTCLALPLSLLFPILALWHRGAQIDGFRRARTVRLLHALSSGATCARVTSTWT